MEVLVEIGLYALFEVIGGLFDASYIFSHPVWLWVLASLVLAIGLFCVFLMVN